MRRKYIVIALLIAPISELLTGFAFKNDFFTITKQDVNLNIPKGFPTPFYSFRDNKLSPEIFTLGRKLFYDPILSHDSTISCASCHQRLAAFAHFDHPLSHGINGLIGKRNVPSLQNLIWKDAFMADGGVNHLEIQPLNPITNPVEMNESLGRVIIKLQQNQSYLIDFKKAYGDTIVSSERILKSLAQFTGLMISANSRYDHYINGTDTFTGSEKTGLALFRKKCTSCHREPLFTDNSYRNNGLNPDSLLNDKGRSIVTNADSDDYKFKVPGLRNIERTYPYMHDGRYRKLKDVINYYSNAGNYNKNADAAMYKIGVLTQTDKDNLLAFLLTLTDNTFLYDKRFIDPFQTTY